MNKKLIEMAKRSPKSFATTILERNKGLLAKLMLLEPYLLNKTVIDIPEGIISEVTQISNIGCPHCDDSNCSICLWNKVYNVFSYGCVNAPFGISHKKSLTLKTVANQGFVRINYYTDKESVGIRDFEYATMKHFRSDWKNCVDFIQAHITWAQLPCWGDIESV